MALIRLSADIAASPEAVFRCFESPEAMQHWIEGLQELRYEGAGPIGVGSAFRQVNKVAGKLETYAGEITAFERPTRFGASVEGDGYHYQMDFVVAPSDPGSRLEYRGELLLTGRVARLFCPIIVYFSRRVFRQEMRNIKRLAESR